MQHVAVVMPENITGPCKKGGGAKALEFAVLSLQQTCLPFGRRRMISICCLGVGI